MKDELLCQLYNPPIREIPSCGILSIRTATEPMNLEKHLQDYEFLYVKSGEKHITVEDVEYTLHGDDLLIIHPGETHGNYHAVQNRSSLYFVLLRNPLLGSSFLHMNETARERIAKKLRETRLAHLSGPCKALYLELFECAQREDMLTEERMRAVALLFLDRFCEDSGDVLRQIPDDIQWVMNFFEENPTQIPHICEMAEMAGLSEPHFKQKFKRCIGVPPAEYIARLRVRQAKTQLSSTQLSITEISKALGFSSAEHFSRLFQRYVGMTPSEYRRKGNEE